MIFALPCPALPCPPQLGTQTLLHPGLRRCTPTPKPPSTKASVLPALGFWSRSCYTSRRRLFKLSESQDLASATVFAQDHRSERSSVTSDTIPYTPWCPSYWPCQAVLNPLAPNLLRQLTSPPRSRRPHRLRTSPRRGGGRSSSASRKRTLGLRQQCMQ